MATIFFNANGGTGSASPTSVSFTAGASITTASQGSLAKTDYKFIGWNSNTSGTGLSYRSAITASFSPTMDTTLYAHWANKTEFIKAKVYYFFRDKGFTKAQAAGVMGNIEQESSWNPLRRSSGSQFWGLVQINSTLSNELHNKYKDAGLDMTKYGYGVSTYWAIGAEKDIPFTDLETIIKTQLDYIYGCKPTGSDWITPVKAATSANEATEAFLVRFEGAVTTSQTEDNKIKYFAPALNKYYQETAKRRTYATTYANKYYF